MRFTRIDELPQLWNVLKGEMSFIGPRAERPFFVEQYSKSIPGYDYRHLINSGITGLAQVEGNYSTTAEDKLRFDLIYLQTFSPLRDFHILMHTVKVMLLKKKRCSKHKELYMRNIIEFHDYYLKNFRW